MKYILLLLSTFLMAHEPIHSSITTYYENIDFKNSVQKNSGNLIGIGGDIHIDNSEFRFAYEYAKTNTKQPPLQDNLKTQKMFLQYGYSFQNALSLNFNYINILNDNIAPTAHGKVYGMGVGYDLNKQIYLNFTQFYSDYKDFNTYQSDLKFEYKTKINAVNIKLTAIAHAIKMDDYQNNAFSKNANNNYLTTGLKAHIHYKTYHLGSSIYFGKRSFAVMNDGFKVQHHAMEFDRTYNFGIGKSFKDFVLRVQTVYQRATELPIKNDNVVMLNLRVIANYKF